MDTVRVEEPVKGVAVVVLDRPESLNAMSRELVRELTATLDEIAGDRSVRAVVLTGAGRGFSSGHDLASIAELMGDDVSVQDRLDVQDMFAGVPLRIRSLPQPVIAAVNGPAAGGGLAMALAADTRVCSESARFNAAFVRLGISGCDVGVSYLLPRVVGPTLAFEMMLTGRLIDADEALRSGLVLRVVPDGKVVDAAVDIAELIMRNSPMGIRQTKQVMWTALELPTLQAAVDLENRTQLLCVESSDHLEALDAFRSKREPVFHDR